MTLDERFWSKVAKLTEEDVVNIRESYAAGGLRQADLALQYGVHQTVISDLVRGRIWARSGGTLTHRYTRYVSL